MLAELNRLHEELLLAISGLDSLVENEAPDRSGLASVRWKLSRASARRLRFLEEAVYPHLLQRVSAAEARQLTDLRAENAALRAASTDHVGQWTIDRAVADWPGYRRASSAMRASMRNRVAAEKAMLYPLLSGGNGDGR